MRTFREWLADILESLARACGAGPAIVTDRILAAGTLARPAVIPAFDWDAYELGLWRDSPSAFWLDPDRWFGVPQTASGRMDAFWLYLNERPARPATFDSTGSSSTVTSRNVQVLRRDLPTRDAAARALKIEGCGQIAWHEPSKSYRLVRVVPWQTDDRVSGY